MPQGSAGQWVGGLSGEEARLTTAAWGGHCLARALLPQSPSPPEPFSPRALLPQSTGHVLVSLLSPPGTRHLGTVLPQIPVIQGSSQERNTKESVKGNNKNLA